MARRTLPWRPIYQRYIGDLAKTTTTLVSTDSTFVDGKTIKRHNVARAGKVVGDIYARLARKRTGLLEVVYSITHSDFPPPLGVFLLTEFSSSLLPVSTGRAEESLKLSAFLYEKWETAQVGKVIETALRKLHFPDDFSPVQAGIAIFTNSAKALGNIASIEMAYAWYWIVDHRYSKVRLEIVGMSAEMKEDWLYVGGTNLDVPALVERARNHTKELALKALSCSASSVSACKFSLGLTYRVSSGSLTIDILTANDKKIRVDMNCLSGMVNWNFQNLTLSRRFQPNAPKIHRSLDENLDSAVRVATATMEAINIEDVVDVLIQEGW